VLVLRNGHGEGVPRVKLAPATKDTVLLHLARSVPITEDVVQLGASVLWANAWHDPAPSEVDAVGMLHLGPGKHQEFDRWKHLLGKGALLLIEDYTPESEAYAYASSLASRGLVSDVSPARHWQDLGVTVFLGAPRP
jgi:hypothetical protein